MITTTDRISGAIAALEKGEQVDWKNLADLQALDQVHAGRRFAEECAAFNEQQNELIKQILGV